MTIFTKSLIQNNLHTVFVNILKKLRGIFLLPIFIKSLGTTVYGSYVLIATILGLLVGISAFGVGFTCRRYLPSANSAEEKRKLFYPQLISNVISVFILSFGSICLWLLYKSRFESLHLHFAIIPLFLFSLMLLRQFGSYFRYTHRIKLYIYSGLFVSYACIGIYLLLLSFGVKLTINMIFFVHGTVAFLTCLFLFSKIYLEINAKFYLYTLKQLVDEVKLGFPIVVNSIMDFLLNGSDKYLIAIFVSLTAVGYYSPAYTLGTIILFFPQVVGVVIPPVLSKAIDEGRKNEGEQLIDYSIKGLLAVGIPFVAGAFLISRPLLKLLANDEIAVHAEFVTPIVGLGCVFYGLTLILANVFIVNLKTKLMLKINLFSASLNIILNITLLYLFRNILFAALTTCVSYLMVFIYSYHKAKQQISIGFDLRFIWKVVASAIIMMLCLKSFDLYVSMFLSDVVSLLLGIVIAIITYSLAFILFRGITLKSLQLFFKNAFI